MMRAIGARKSFLRRMLVSETGLLSFFFGGLGIVGGIIIIVLLKSAGISTSNEVLQLVYGGDNLNPIFTFADFIFEVIELGIVTLLAVLYPLRIINRITPLDATVHN
jgi:ABC-type antimicrobial peptide transport system permease subunit